MGFAAKIIAFTLLTRIIVDFSWKLPAYVCVCVRARAWFAQMKSSCHRMTMFGFAFDRLMKLYIHITHATCTDCFTHSLSRYNFA